MTGYSEKVLVLTDGNCNLCNGIVDFLQKYNTRKRLFFTPFQSLQGGIFENMVRFDENFTANPDSLHVLANGRVYKGSDAALQIVSQLPGLWKTLLVFRFVPRVLRNWLYGFIAKNRYKWFGKSQACSIYRHSTPNKI